MRWDYENGVHSSVVKGYYLQVAVLLDGASWLVKDGALTHGGHEPTYYLAQCRCEAWLRLNGVVP